MLKLAHISRWPAKQKMCLSSSQNNADHFKGCSPQRTVSSAGCSNKHDMTALPAAAPITSSKVNTSLINFHKLWWDRDTQQTRGFRRVKQRRRRRKNKGMSARNNKEQSRGQDKREEQSSSPGLLTSLRASGESCVVVVVVETVGPAP